MSRKAPPAWPDVINEQGADALLKASVAFLRSNRISEKTIQHSLRNQSGRMGSRSGAAQYRKLISAYEDMGMLMATWFSRPQFLDEGGRPIPLTLTQGRRSIRHLMRVSRVTVPLSLADEMLRRSPSIVTGADDRFVALRRVFVLPEFEIARAALVIERYLGTLRRNASGRKNDTALLLERNCHVTNVNLKTIAPMLRDVKERGTAFIDSIDGEMEEHRLRKSTRKDAGEMGVLIVAWTKPDIRLSDGNPNRNSNGKRNVKPNGKRNVKSSGKLNVKPSPKRGTE